MKFKDLNNGQEFEFANPASAYSLGPWIKVSRRKYMASEVTHRLNGVEIEVGSWNVEVLAR